MVRSDLTRSAAGRAPQHPNPAHTGELSGVRSGGSVPTLSPELTELVDDLVITIANALSASFGGDVVALRMAVQTNDEARMAMARERAVLATQDMTPALGQLLVAEALSRLGVT